MNVCVVNYKFLEDCFNNWIIHQPCREKYIIFKKHKFLLRPLKNLISNKYVREYIKLTISAFDTSDNKTIQTRQPTQQKRHIPEEQPLSAITTTATTTTATGTTTKAATATKSTRSSNIKLSTVTSATLLASHSVSINNLSLPSSFKARRSKRSKAPTLLFTGFTESLTGIKKEIQRLNFTLTEDVYNATHFITDGNILRTVKFLSAVNLGLKITTKKWLEASIKDRMLLDPDEFPLVDEIVEREQMFIFEIALKKLILFFRIKQRKKHLGTDYKSAGGHMMKKIKELNHSNSCNLVIIDPINQAEKSRLVRMGYKVYNKDVVIITSLRQSMKELDQFVVE
ncbi:hypothetical protein BDC45DRAFT_539110 [Circinella umbellata]|nr:hypothetical protein BDC45DRAFT_539110 [Circinella umbellata]